MVPVSSNSIDSVSESDLLFLASFIHDAKLSPSIDRFIFKDLSNEAVKIKMCMDAIQMDILTLRSSIPGRLMPSPMKSLAISSLHRSNRQRGINRLWKQRRPKHPKTSKPRPSWGNS